ncbi:hypothetical protein [Hyphomicrobium sp.]|uniref:hypothetical protein n=1 Tax=Hyphomicrobium sp. TaxID=82 RepID=UPI0025C6BE64|nr:hypothetical protein [Hyphomicrobium sp.]MCC7250910.1 hypothetical protein [Hyphomicrobium sp.]
MARTLICHVPKDASLARELGAALMGRGHFVSFDGEPDNPRPERASRLRQFEAVIVLWTEASAPTVGLADIARETLPLNLLVPVRAADLAPTKLPLMFRKLNMLAPRDIDGIARVIARMSAAATSLREMSEREAARRASGEPALEQTQGTPLPAPPLPKRTAAPAKEPPPAKPGAETGPVSRPGAGVRVRPLSDLPEVEADAALIAAAQQRSEPERAPQPQVRMSADAGQRSTEPPRSEPPRPATQVLSADDLARAVDAGLLVPHVPDVVWLGAPTTVEVTLGRHMLAGLMQQGHNIETLSVSVYGSAEAFEIERQSERTQFVSAKHALAARDPATFGRWAWLLTPYAAGPQDLVIRISALLRDRHGVPAPVAIPDRRLSIEIQVPENESLVSALAGWHRR